MLVVLARDLSSPTEFQENHFHRWATQIHLLMSLKVIAKALRVKILP
jgi:hypothetical protein